MPTRTPSKGYRLKLSGSSLHFTDKTAGCDLHLSAQASLGSHDTRLDPKKAEFNHRHFGPRVEYPPKEIAHGWMMD